MHACPRLYRLPFGAKTAIGLCCTHESHVRRDTLQLNKTDYFHPESALLWCHTMGMPFMFKKINFKFMCNALLFQQM